MFYDKSPEEIPALIENSMREVYAGIKPNDIILVGAFQKLGNQIRENADIASRVLSKM